MRLIQLYLITTAIFFTNNSFADEAKTKTSPCGVFYMACKNDPTVTAATDKHSKMKAISACVTAAAKNDADNGPKCLAMQEQMRAKHLAHPHPVSPTDSH